MEKLNIPSFYYFCKQIENCILISAFRIMFLYLHLNLIYLSFFDLSIYIPSLYISIFDISIYLSIFDLSIYLSILDLSSNLWLININSIYLSSNYLSIFDLTLYLYTWRLWPLLHQNLSWSVLFLATCLQDPGRCQVLWPPPRPRFCCPTFLKFAGVWLHD